MVIGIRYEWIVIISSSTTCNFSAIKCFIFKSYMHQMIQHENNIWNDLKWFSLQSSELSASLVIIFWLKTPMYFKFISIATFFLAFQIITLLWIFVEIAITFFFRFISMVLYCILLWSFSHVLFNIHSYGAYAMKLAQFLHFRGTVNLYTTLFKKQFTKKYLKP